MDDWRIAAELATRFGVDFGFDTVDDVQDEIARVAPAFAGVDAELMRRARDGAVLPIVEHPDELVLHATLGVSTGVSWEPIKPGVAFDDTHLSSIGTGAVESSGTGSLSTIKPGLTEGAGPRTRPPTTTRPSRARRRGRRRAHRRTGAPRVGRRGARRSRPSRPTRTASASWWRGASTTSAAPRRRATRSPASPTAPRCSCTRPTCRASAWPTWATTCSSPARAPRSRLPVRTDPSVAPGTAFIPFAQGGPENPAALIDANSAVTDVRVETTR